MSQNKFNGFCEVCGDKAELRQAQSTALLQSRDTNIHSVIGTNLARCLSGDHAYYVLNWKTQVEDPFDDREVADIVASTEPLPPPPPKED